MITTIPDHVGDCFETPTAISSGTGGFSSGYIYLAYPDPANATHTIVGKIPQTGGSIIPVGPGIPVGIGGANGFLSLRFDTVGTFGFNLIMLTGDGEIFILDSTGTTVVHKTTADTGLPPGNQVIEYESPRVAPLTFGLYGGWLWLVNENVLPSGQVWAISPVTFKATLLPFNFDSNPTPRGPEDIVFFGPAPACKFNGATVVQAVYEGPLGSPNAANNGSVQFVDMSAFPNSGMIISEDRGYAAFVNLDGTRGATAATYTPAGNFLEHLNPVVARAGTSCTPVQGCTLTQGGYKNHFNSQVVNLPLGGLFLGTHFYTNSQLNDILQNNAIKGNGLLSLAHQLITAELNVFYSAQPNQQVADAIVAANALIGSLAIPPIGSGSLDPSVTSSLESILDNFNNGNVAGAPHCN